MAGTRSGGRKSRGGTVGGRSLTQRVKTARGRKLGSTRWLQRQLNDPYVQEARRLGYRSRAAFKLQQIDDKFALLKPGLRVVDLGAAPGGWLQIAAGRMRLTATATDPGSAGGFAEASGALVGFDLEDVEPVAGAVLLRGDFLAADAPDRIRSALGGAADLVLSDMAASTTGHAATDHLRTMALAEAAVAFAADALAPGGAIVVKLLQGADEPALFERVRLFFTHVRRFKPKASRPESTELYIVGFGFRG
jgi:23S rRNA (uridine2552-2'-O)-methyltransferase